MGNDTVYQMVTERIVAMLEQGTVPWRKPWTAASFPRNIEGRRYRGVNVFLLAMSGYTSPFWLTFNQAKQRGGSVKKGEKGTTVVFWKRIPVTETDDAGKQTKKIVPMLRYFTVFNLEQTEGVKLPKAVADFDAAQAAHVTSTEAEAIIADYPNRPAITETGDEAFYLPGFDSIQVPPRGQFPNSDEFYSTLFHELGHSTGHPSRLDRKQTGGFGSHDYGREELIAEMTAAFLCAEAGIDMTMPNHASYLASWIKTISEDTRAVVVAAGAAQRAADHILGRTFEDAGTVAA